MKEEYGEKYNEIRDWIIVYLDPPQSMSLSIQSMKAVNYISSYWKNKRKDSHWLRDKEIKKEIPEVEREILENILNLEKLAKETVIISTRKSKEFKILAEKQRLLIQKYDSLVNIYGSFPSGSI